MNAIIDDAFADRIAIFPVTALLAAVKAMSGVYAHLKEHGSSTGIGTPLEDFVKLTQLMGFEDVWEFEKRHAEKENA